MRSGSGDCPTTPYRLNFEVAFKPEDYWGSDAVSVRQAAT